MQLPLRVIFALLIALIFAPIAAQAQFLPLLGVGGAAPSGGCTQATNYFAQNTTISGAQKTAMQTMICGLVTDGVITDTMAGSGHYCGSVLDFFYVLAVDTAANALLDLCNHYPATANNSPSFTAYQGYTGTDASSGGPYINTGFNPNTAGGNFSSTSASIGAWVLGTVADATNGGAIMGVANGDFSGATRILPARPTDGHFETYVLGQELDPSTAINASGFYVAEKSPTIPDTEDWYNGVEKANTTSVGTTVPNDVMYLLAYRFGGAGDNAGYTLAAAVAGANLTSTLQGTVGGGTGLVGRLCTYLTAVNGAC